MDTCNSEKLSHKDTEKLSGPITHNDTESGKKNLPTKKKKKVDSLARFLRNFLKRTNPNSSQTILKKNLKELSKVKHSITLTKKQKE